MKPKIYIHIGLPKTATTSLQLYVFPEIARKYNYIYVGVDQPRGESSKKHPLYSAFMTAIDDGEFNAFHQQMPLISQCKGIIISEEMLTASANGIGWDEKLENLSELLADYDYEILVSLRHPVEAVFSYYVERYDSLKTEFPVFNIDVVTHPYMKVFKYTSFLEFLEEHFDRKKIHYAAFDRIIKGELEQVCSFLGVDQFACVSMGQSNSKKQNTSHVYAQSKFSKYDRVVIFFSKRLGGRYKPVFRAFIKPILSPLLSWARPVYKVRKMSAETEAAVLGALRDDIATFERVTACRPINGEN